MTVALDDQDSPPEVSCSAADLPVAVLTEIQTLLASLVEGRSPLPDIDAWHISATRLDVVTSPAVRAAWLITIVDERSGEVEASTIILEPRESEVAG